MVLNVHRNTCREASFFNRRDVKTPCLANDICLTPVFSCGPSNGNWPPTLRASLSGAFLQRKDVVNQCLEFGDDPQSWPVGNGRWWKLATVHHTGVADIERSWPVGNGRWWKLATVHHTGVADIERSCGTFMTVSGTLCVSSLQQRLFSQKEAQMGGVENMLSVQKTVCRARLLNCSLGVVAGV